MTLWLPFWKAEEQAENTTRAATPARHAPSPCPPSAMPLPGLFIIGAQKCGTSTLHACLSSHDQIRPAQDPSTGRIVKEVNFFGNRWDEGVQWYLSHFGHTDGVGLDATPNYLCDVHAHSRMFETVPNAKLVISLRDPVARLYSQFNHYTQKVETTRSWDWEYPGESLRKNIEAEFEKPRRRWYGLLARGYYDSQLEHLLQFFPRDQIHVMIMERWVNDPERSFEALLEFAELPAQTLAKKVVHMRSYTVDPIEPSTQNWLAELYRPHNERLFQRLGESIEEWT